MPFMVIYSTSDGGSCHEQADAIDEAALFVERLRNQDGIEEIRIFRMEEISFAFRPYYKVELGMPERMLVTSPPPEVLGTAPAAADAASPADEPSLELDQPVEVTAAPPAPAADGHLTAASMEDPDSNAANGRRGLFGR